MSCSPLRQRRQRYYYAAAAAAVAAGRIKKSRKRRLQLIRVTRGRTTRAQKKVRVDQEAKEQNDVRSHPACRPSDSGVSNSRAIFTTRNPASSSNTSEKSFPPLFRFPSCVSCRMEVDEGEYMKNIRLRRVIS